ncbi:superoxide dismutase [Luteolibacter yonseiensis]|uniref:Superoxide dismutase n=1 Tax=Luteolibacter yonseiensis TaxID=1144680 RepID=A0A934R5N8_9BACT|nr:superoxide dismutase [Luteolibacter yonseiensis]MBK1816706.1 superoxide dismutase [Luteolibacter yonseiensis]
MKNSSNIDRRHFVKLGTLAASATLLPSASRAAETAAAPYSLPPLPFAAEALEPHIDAKTMEIHHGKHHQAYITNLNTALAAAPQKVGGQPLQSLLADLSSVSDEALRTTVRNNGGGHWNHDFFWKSLSPADKSGKPSAELAKAIDAAFGSFDEFKKAFAASATKNFGSGWTWLVSQDGKLKITSTPNQDNPLMKGVVKENGTPLLGLDTWEHAYYLHYQNRRPDYIAAFWNVVNWQAVSGRFKA